MRSLGSIGVDRDGERLCDALTLARACPHGIWRSIGELSRCREKIYAIDEASHKSRAPVRDYLEDYEISKHDASDHLAIKNRWRPRAWRAFKQVAIPGRVNEPSGNENEDNKIKHERLTDASWTR
jgi:hypothetical protein